MGPIKRIVDETGHVLTFSPRLRSDEEFLQTRREGWRKASIFPGFCKFHDGSTFAPLENAKFVGSEQQCFLIGFRAICHEIYKKTSAVCAYPFLRDHLDRGRSPHDQLAIQEQVWNSYNSQLYGLRDLYNIKGFYDCAIRGERIMQFNRCIIYIEEDLDIVSAGVLSTDYDLQGNFLQAGF